MVIDSSCGKLYHMTNTKKLYYIAFYRYDDSKIWQRTNLIEKKEVLEKELKQKDYIDQNSINIVEIYLPE